jgi:hypothetical protein
MEAVALARGTEQDYSGQREYDLLKKKDNSLQIIKTRELSLIFALCCFPKF